ncbi:hypothetical protein Hanom_Chr02g00130571 [Helianthus anomalus]
MFAGHINQNFNWNPFGLVIQPAHFSTSSANKRDLKTYRKKDFISIPNDHLGQWSFAPDFKSLSKIFPLVITHIGKYKITVCRCSSPQ